MEYYIGMSYLTYCRSLTICAPARIPFQGGLLNELDQDMDTTQSRLKATQKKMQVSSRILIMIGYYCQGLNILLCFLTHGYFPAFTSAWSAWLLIQTLLLYFLDVLAGCHPQEWGKYAVLLADLPDRRAGCPACDCFWLIFAEKHMSCSNRGFIWCRFLEHLKIGFEGLGGDLFACFSFCSCFSKNGSMKIDAYLWCLETEVSPCFGGGKLRGAAALPWDQEVLISFLLRCPCIGTYRGLSFPFLSILSSACGCGMQDNWLEPWIRAMPLSEAHVAYPPSDSITKVCCSDSLSWRSVAHNAPTKHKTCVATVPFFLALCWPCARVALLIGTNNKAAPIHSPNFFMNIVTLLHVIVCLKVYCLSDFGYGIVHIQHGIHF